VESSEPPMDQNQATTGDDARLEVTKEAVEELRKRLLDLRNSNRLLNFRFSDRSRTHVRVIDELPDFLFEKLNAGKPLTFQALPEPDDEPKDEQRLEFGIAYSEARATDTEYLRELAGLGEADDASSPAVQKIERALKDRVRQQLGWSKRAAKDTMSPAEYAEARGFDSDYDLPRPLDDGHKKEHQDRYIQTLLFPDQMERKLSGVRDGARSARQEMGVEILFAAFGYLEWYDAGQGKKR